MECVRHFIDFIDRSKYIYIDNDHLIIEFDDGGVVENCVVETESPIAKEFVRVVCDCTSSSSFEFESIIITLYVIGLISMFILLLI